MNTHTAPPTDPQALLQAGMAASQAGRGDEAIAHFEAAAQQAPHAALPMFLLGSEYAASGRYEAAERCLAAAVLLDASLLIARYQLGLLQFSSGRPTAALVTWEPLQATPADSGLPDFVAGFGLLCADDLAAARAAFERGLAGAQVNQAVAGDVRRILGQLEQLPSAADASPPAATPVHAPAQALAPVMAPAHVLLANYEKGRLH